MAIINNLSASITSFKVNNTSTNFQNCGGTYNTSNILNGGETYDETEGTQNLLSYDFRITGLQDHTIRSIVVNTLLLDSTGELCSTKRFIQSLDGVIINAEITGNISSKVIGSTEFNLSKLIEDSSYEFTLELQNSSLKSCYYGLESLVIYLSDIDYKINIQFSGPSSGRSTSNISTSALLLNLNAESVTFSKDPTTAFNSEVDNVEGRIYFKQDGIYVDNYQYGTVANTWRPVYAYQLIAQNGQTVGEIRQGTTDTKALSFGSDFLAKDVDTSNSDSTLPGSEIYLAWAEVDENGNITYAI